MSYEVIVRVSAPVGESPMIRKTFEKSVFFQDDEDRECGIAAIYQFANAFGLEVACFSGQESAF